MNNLSEFIFQSKYSRYRSDLGRKETWDESVERIAQMHMDYLFELHPNIFENVEFASDFIDAIDLYKNKKILGSQRALQFGGEPILKKHARLFNCSFTYCDRLSVFKEIEWVLLCGVGVGISVEHQHIDKLPDMNQILETAHYIHVIEDSIEGWAYAVDALINYYFKPNRQYPKFDYSQIRPEGSFISSGFLAPGPKGLKKALQKVEERLEQIYHTTKRLSALDCSDIIGYLADSILSGGVRRCLRGTDEVITNKGLVQLKDLKIGDLVLTHDKSFQKVTNKIYNGIRPVSKITTNLHSVYSTQNHRWLVANTISGKTVEKLTSELEIGDVLLLNNLEHSGLYQDFPQYNNLKLPKLDTETAWFIGYFLGNRSVSQRFRTNTNAYDNKFRISCPTNYPTICEKVETAFNKIVGDKYTTYNKGTSIEFTTSKEIITNYFLHIKQPNTSIVIPEFIKQNTREIQLAFLAGLLDSDESVRNETINNKGTGQITLLSSKYEKFIEEVQTLYNFVGIITKRQDKHRQGKSTEFILKTVSSTYRNKCYYDLLEYSEKLKEDYELKSTKRENYGIIYPNSLAIEGERTKIWNSNKNCSLEKILQYYSNLSYIPAVITNIEEDYSNEEVYDIEVKKNHNFYINGTLTHNSAVSILFSPDNENMKKCKTGNWFYDNPQRARFNMSAVLERGETPYKIYTELFKDVKEYGEPGFVWRSKNTVGYNPCFEIGFEPIYEGQVGWQFCNLATINGGLVETEAEFYECCKAVSTLATIQATYNKFDFLGDITEKLAKADPLIGISVTGIVTNPDVLLNEEILKNGANLIKEQNKKIANILGINYASRTTCIKPEGTSSLLLNTTSGCHGEHARNYIRRVQVNKTEEIAEIYKKYNPNAVIDSVWSANNTDYCIMFPVTINNRTWLKEDLYGIKQLMIVKSLFTNWVLEGMNNPASPIQNNVSNTVIVPEDDWDDVMDYVWNNQYSFAGISFIPQTGDLDFNQPPYTEVLMPEELLNIYGNGIIFASGLIVDAEKIFGNLWTACDQFLGKGEKLYSTEKDAIDFLKEYHIENDESYLDKPYREYKEASILQYNKWYDLLTDMGYPEDFVEPILDNDLQYQIPLKEFQNYLDRTTIHNVSRLSEKRDIMRRFKKFACKYFDCDEMKMIYALKHVQLYHDWCAITKDEKIIDWSTIKWKKVLTNADETAALACSGGSCEITKI